MNKAKKTPLDLACEFGRLKVWKYVYVIKYIYKHQCIVNRIRNIMEKIIYSRFITNKVNIIKSFCFSFDDYGLQNMNICRM